MRMHLPAVLAACLLTGLLGAAHANDADRQRLKGLQDRIQRQQQQLMQLQDEKQAALEAKTAADKQADALRSEREAVRRQLLAAQRDLDTLRSAQQAQQALQQGLQDRAAALERQLDEARAATRGVQAELARSQADGRAVAAARDERAAALASCERTNAQMYALNSELLALYSDAAGRSASAGFGGLTQLRRVVVENRAEQMRDRLDEQRLPPQR